MQRLIDADKTIECMQYYHDDCAKTSEYTRLGFETAIEVVKDAPTVLTIPDNPTNGDMIKALFPNIKFNEKWKATRHFELQSEQGHIEITGIATSDWWNSPFEPQKSEVEDGNK